MNKKGFELAISTLILLILGVVLLAGLVYLVTDGFEKFRGIYEPPLSTVVSSVFKESCRVACEGEDKISYCCNSYDYKKDKIYCHDERLELECSLDCTDFVCEE